MLLFDAKNITVNIIKNSKEEYLFLNDGESFEKNKEIKPILEYLKSKSQRVIPLQEIALAVIKCCCDKDCNPNFNRVENLVKKTMSTLTCGEALVLNTESQAIEMVDSEMGIVIPPSYENPISMDCSGSKRQGEEIERNDIETKVVKTSVSRDVHQKSPKKLTQPSISNFIESNKSSKRKLCITQKAAQNNEIIEITDDDNDNENNNVFKRPKIAKHTKPISQENNKEVLSSTVLSQNDGDSRQSFFNLDMSMIKVSDNYQPKDHEVGGIRNKKPYAVDPNLDPEMREFIESFRNTAIVVEKSLKPLEKSRNSTSNVTDSSSTSGVKNFKKFRKVSV